MVKEGLSIKYVNKSITNGSLNIYPLFKNISNDALDFIIKYMVDYTFNENAIIINKTNVTSTVFVIFSGTVLLTKY